eukprot:TRINITY_DN36444_c0_g1_i1.p1 TRINITY_DN36444_c0_g1~~TRINITY_DN36444_c0_g1_i1.p1  ORF type:complete len:152 (+),score=19.02 TRINITY_DN36444_c0_g1_i1:23-478(+)
MEWFEALINFNSTSLKAETKELVGAASSFGTSLLTSFIEHVAFPVGSFLRRNAEEAVRYSLNGDYQRIEELAVESVNSTLSWLQLSAFQTKLIWEFILIILGNSFFVLVAWKWYGERFRKKFMLAGRRNIEDIRVSYSELKLPQEMDFKFK